ncbi:TrlF family AAA-like ATPase [Candidatus Poriferisodalis sp.]|uniref:TrlF family AAA-like ATPase n=1 Tax=Candidatus Poriferisodalis sp. TaxID=3101277 RepID=UPI003B02CD2B
MAADDADSGKYPGARWWKFDFHAHTPASSDYRTPESMARRPSMSAEAWLLAHMKAEIDCVAVTDLHSGDWIDELQSTLAEMECREPAGMRPLCLFPGVEIVASGGTHILAIFDPGTGKGTIDGVLAAVRYRGLPGEVSEAAQASVMDVAASIAELDGIAIPARVDSNRGVWEQPGNTLEPLLDCGHVFAIETVGTEAPRRHSYEQRHLAWPSVLGSETSRLTRTHAPDPLGRHFTWVKMEQPSIDGLRLALLDGDYYSIQRSDVTASPKPPALPRERILGIRISEAKFMGRGSSADLRFSPWFNVIIGGRGSGKSTVLHCMRLAAQREAELKRLSEHSSTRLTFEHFNRIPDARSGEGGLTADARIEWEVLREATPHRVHRRLNSGDDEPVVEQRVGGAWTRSVAQHVTSERFPLRLFSQGQISELAGENQNSLFDLIDEGAQAAAVQQSFEEACRRYWRTCERVRELDQRLVRSDDVEVRIEDIERKVQTLAQSGHAEAVQALRHQERAQRELDRQFSLADEFHKRLLAAAEQFAPEDVPEGALDSTTVEGQEALAVIDRLHDAERGAADRLKQAANDLRQAIEQQRATLREGAWQRQAEQIRSDYAAAVDALGASEAGDPGQHARWLQERQGLLAERERLVAERAERDELAAQAEQQLGEVTIARRELSAARSAFLEHTLAENKFVRIRLVPYGDALANAERSFREIIDVPDQRFAQDIGGDADSPDAIINGLLSELPDDVEVRRDAVEGRLEALRRRIRDACTGSGSFHGHFNNYFSARFSQEPGFLDRILTWFPPDSLHVEYSRSSDGDDFVPIKHGSAGQRAAAMLAFLLAYGDEPLVLDQPEDDLDNQLIYGLVVQQIRDNKMRRQIIAVTHNPNIVVNGDAEMVHVLDFVDGQCRVVQAGSLQRTEVRDEVCKVMEGGREALERRYRRLEIRPSNV